MTTTAPQALTKLINHVEGVTESLERDEYAVKLRDVVTSFCEDYPEVSKKYGSLDDWEVSLCSAMLAGAIYSELGKTKNPLKNFRALDAGMNVLTQNILILSEQDIELAINLGKLTESLSQTYIQICLLQVATLQSKKAATKLFKFMTDGSSERVGALLQEAQGFKN
ncbi:hypothetical protein [Synechococcus sp. PROS-9-1]|uniref:hypothetical protein n=1 Tax=Synechococcus sp. PROS-9-1 TaxID=1968775 RepID=UPI001647B239|nr:hypothetical protein [Synechococcus sp. PROS-9-1]